MSESGNWWRCLSGRIEVRAKSAVAASRDDAVVLEEYVFYRTERIVGMVIPAVIGDGTSDTRPPAESVRSPQFD